MSSRKMNNVRLSTATDLNGFIRMGVKWSPFQSPDGRSGWKSEHGKVSYTKPSDPGDKISGSPKESGGGSDKLKESFDFAKEDAHPSTHGEIDKLHKLVASHKNPAVHEMFHDFGMFVNDNMENGSSSKGVVKRTLRDMHSELKDNMKGWHQPATAVKHDAVQKIREKLGHIPAAAPPAPKVKPQKGIDNLTSRKTRESLHNSMKIADDSGKKAILDLANHVARTKASKSQKQESLRELHNDLKKLSGGEKVNRKHVVKAVEKMAAGWKKSGVHHVASDFSSMANGVKHGFYGNG